MPEEEMVTTPEEELEEEVGYKALYEKSQADVEKCKGKRKRKGSIRNR